MMDFVVSLFLFYLLLYSLLYHVVKMAVFWLISLSRLSNGIFSILLLFVAYYFYVCIFIRTTDCFHQEATRPAIPILLAVGAVHQHLIQNGLRMQASIVADTAQCFSTHQFACLIGYGARSVLLSNLFMHFYMHELVNSSYISFVKVHVI